MGSDRIGLLHVDSHYSYSIAPRRPVAHSNILGAQTYTEVSALVVPFVGGVHLFLWREYLCMHRVTFTVLLRTQKFRKTPNASFMLNNAFVTSYSRLFLSCLGMGCPGRMSTSVRIVAEYDYLNVMFCREQVGSKRVLPVSHFLNEL